MNQLNAKIKLIFYPFLVIGATLIIGYSILNWYLFIKLYPFLVKEEIRNILIPFVLPWIPLFVWLRPRLKLLEFKKTARDPIFGGIVLACIAISIPIILAQAYVATASGKLTQLRSVDDIALTKETRYYDLNNYVIDNVYTGSYFRHAITGKHHETLSLSLFIVCPLYDKSKLPVADVGKVPHHLKAPKAAESQLPSFGEQDSNALHPITLGQTHGLGRTPLFVVDGMVTDTANVSKISSDDILKVDVLKGKPAVEVFGEQGNDGVVIITTTKGTSQAFVHTSPGPLPDSIVVDTSTPEPEPALIGNLAQDTSTWPLAWVGVKYSKEFNNGLSAEEKQERIADFKSKSWADYDKRKTTGYTYFDEIPYDDDYIAFQKAASNTDRFGTQKRFRLLEPKEGAFDQRNGSKLPWVFGSFLIGSSILMLVLVLTPLKKQDEELQDVEETKWHFRDAFRSVIEFLVPREQFYATPIILDINLAIFIAMVISGLGFIEFDAKSLIPWGASYGPLNSSNQWWRLLTSTFLHGGVMHLLVNMYALLYVGLFLEPVLGKSRFAVCYLATGLVASLVSFKIHPFAVSVGASGAIFGMYGIFLAFMVRGVLPPGFRKAFLFSTLFFVGFNLLAGLSGNTDNAAHIGGLLSGFLIGVLIGGSIKREKEDIN